MSWVEFTSIVGEMGLTFGILTGLSGWLGKLWADRLMANGKHQHDKELEELRKKLETTIKEMEHSHQISQKTYQNLFEKKIEIYQLLLQEKVEYLKVINEDPRYEYEGKPKSFYNLTFKKIKNIISENKLYISNALAEKYDILYNKNLPYMNQLAQDELYDDLDKGSRSLVNDEPIYEKMYSTTSADMQSLFDQIDDDIALIKAKIDLDR